MKYPLHAAGSQQTPLHKQDGDELVVVLPGSQPYESALRLRSALSARQLVCVAHAREPYIILLSAAGQRPLSR
jgi:hypothetical protein